MDFFVALLQRLIVADLVMAATLTILIFDMYRRGLYEKVSTIEGALLLPLAVVCSGSVVLTIGSAINILWLVIFH